LWAATIGLPFLLWWRPFWQAALIVSWGWAWAIISYLITDSAASHWCFFVSFYAAFTLIYAFMVKDPPRTADQHRAIGSTHADGHR